MPLPLKIAFLGPLATFSHEAARQQFSDGAEYLPQRTIPDVFYATANNQVDFGVVPGENALEGAVTYTLDMFARPDPELSSLIIGAEINLPIEQTLLVHRQASGTFSDITTVYSHPQGLAQCRVWLENNLPHATLQETTSTSRAAELAAENTTAAAIGSRLAIEYLPLRVLVASMQDADFNQTRFLVICQPDKLALLPQKPLIDHSQSMTSLMLSIKDRVGALHAVTSVFARYALNMNRIQSRPSRQKAWDYYFFIDFQGHPDQPAVAQALRELHQETVWVRVLGSWQPPVD